MSAVSPDSVHSTPGQQSNYAETIGEDAGEASGKSRHAKGKARTPITDQRKVNLLGNSPATKRKKSTMAVRTALLYPTNFNALLEKSVRGCTECSSSAFTED